MKSHSITVFNSQYSIVILNRHQIKPFFQVEIGNKKLKEKTLPKGLVSWERLKWGRQWWCGWLWSGTKNVKNWCNTVKKAVGDKWSTAVVIEMSEMLAQLISILSFWERWSNTNITSFCHRYCPLAGNCFFNGENSNRFGQWTATNPFFTPYIWKTWLGVQTGNQRTTREWMRPGNWPGKCS
jgi:hypothetical protein